MPSAQSLAAVQQVYIAYYGRPADPAGLEFWANQLDSVAGDFSQIIAAFANSAEATALYGENQANTDLINSIYQNLLGRPAEPEGLAFWLGTLNTQRFNQDNIVLAILQSAREGDANLVANKIALANQFTQAIVDGNVPYAGDAASAVARTLMQLVSSAENGGVAQNMVDAYLAAVRIATQTPATFDGLIESGFLIDPSIVRPGFNLDGSEINPQPSIPIVIVPTTPSVIIQSEEGGDVLTFTNTVIETLVVKGNGAAFDESLEQRTALTQAREALAALQEEAKGASAESLKKEAELTDAELIKAKAVLNNLADKLKANAADLLKATGEVTSINGKLLTQGAEETELTGQVVESKKLAADAFTSLGNAKDEASKAEQAVKDATTKVGAADTKLADAKAALGEAKNALSTAKAEVDKQKKTIATLENEAKAADGKVVDTQKTVDDLTEKLNATQKEVDGQQLKVDDLKTALDAATKTAVASAAAALASDGDATKESFTITINQAPGDKDVIFKLGSIEVEIEIKGGDKINDIGDEIKKEFEKIKVSGKELFSATFKKDSNVVEVSWKAAGAQQNPTLNEDVASNFTIAVTEGRNAGKDPLLVKVADDDEAKRAEVQKDFDDVTSKLSDLKALLEDYKGDLSTAQTSLDAAQEAHTAAKAAVTAANTKLEELDKVATAADAAVSKADASVETADAEDNAAKEDLAATELKKAAADKALTDAQTKLDAAQKTVDGQEDKLKALQADIEKVKAELADASGKVDTLTSTETELKAEQSEAAEMVDSLEAQLKGQNSLLEKFTEAEAGVSSAEGGLNEKLAEFQSDSFFSRFNEDAPGTWDVVTGFNPNQDKLKLDFSAVLADLDLKGYTVANGVVSIEEFNGLEALPVGPVIEAPVFKVPSWTHALFDVVQAIGESTEAFALVQGGNTYVFQGNGVAGFQDSDVFVQLTGVTVNDLSAILAA